MARPENVPQNHIDAVGADLNGLLHVGPTGIGTMVHIDGTTVNEPAPSFGPAFSVWTITRPGILKGAEAGSDIGEVARRTGRLHHQMILQNELGYARSAETPADAPANAPALLEFSTSPLADRVGDAYAWVQAHAPDDPLVRLLEIPSYQTHALWLWHEETESSDGAVIVSAPEFIGFRRYAILSSSEFLRTLARAEPVAHSRR